MKRSGFFDYLKQQYKLSLRDIRSGEEIWHLFTSRIRLILVFVTSLILGFIIILTIVAYTPILDLVPGYPGNKARKALISNIMRLDSLERLVISWENYHSNLSLILEGKDPVPFDPDSLPKLGVKTTPAARSLADSLLRATMESDSAYMALQASHRRVESRFEIVPPVTGTITRTFNPAGRFFGIDITPLPGQAIMSIMDGTIVSISWDPVSGYILVIQHGGNMMSIYKTSMRTLKQVGERVKAGEAIALLPSDSPEKAPSLTFELWYNGNPVDPENYITF